MTTLRELLDDLDARGRLGADADEQIAAHLESREDEAPWYVSALIGLGAWVAMLFLLSALGALLDWGGRWPQWAVAALLLAGAGLGLRRASRHLFVVQVSLALCLAGWGAACVAGADAGELGTVTLAALAAGVLLYLLHPDAALRFLVTFGAAAFVASWFGLEFESLPIVGRNVPVLLLAFGSGLVLARPGVPRVWLPLGHAVAVAAIVAVPLLGFDWRASQEPIPWWPSVVLITLGLAALVVHVLRPVDEAVRREALPLALGAVLLIGAACWFGGPGLLVAIGLLLLGHATARPSLEGLALVALPFFLFLYYRDLDTSLMAKSLSLVGAGAVLLVLRRVLSRRPWAREAS